jgi:hypothetical protein
VVFALAWPAAAAAQAPKPAVFGNGELRFVNAGREYSLAITELTDPDTGKQRPNPSRYSWQKDAMGNGFHRSVLDFGRPGPEEATITLTLPGTGDHWATALGARFELIVRLPGKVMRLTGDDFPGCALKVSQLDASGVKGSMSCPRRPPGGLSDIEFSATP